MKAKLPLIIGGLLLASSVGFAAEGDDRTAVGNPATHGATGESQTQRQDRMNKQDKMMNKRAEVGSTSGATTGAGAAMASEPATTMRQIKRGQDYATIEFKKGSSDITESSKKSLKSMIDAARSRGEIDQLHVAVFADKAFPAGANAKDLPDADRTLVQNRIDAIDKYVKDGLNVSGIESYNMAERSNWFARAFDTKDAELKSLFSQQGAPADVDPQELSVVKKEGGPSKAVVLLEMEDKD